MKRTYQPSRLKRKRRHGFRARNRPALAVKCSLAVGRKGASACRLKAERETIR